MSLVSELEEWKALEALSARNPCLQNLLMDKRRNESLLVNFSDIWLDLSRSKINEEILTAFESLFQRINLSSKIENMFSGKKINETENRAVLHTALRKLEKHDLIVDGLDVYPAVMKVLGEIEQYSGRIRGGEIVGLTGKKFTNIVCIGIGGSYLGPEFVYEALRSDYRPNGAAIHGKGMTMRFLANVDPVDVGRALEGLDPESTLAIIISKTFTTAETMLNAVTVRDWVLKHYGSTADSEQGRKIVNAHFCAISTALDKTEKFGISKVFGFWDWVGGRFSVCSAVGVLPLSLYFGFDVCREFLRGANAIDEHFLTEKNFRKNIPSLMGMISVWNSSFLKIRSNAILPYAQALVRFVAHIQQVDMESNGKRVDMSGRAVDFSTGQVILGEPGTNGQHSFYQLIHQGPEVLSCDFIGFKESTNPISMTGEPLGNHDELMSNFFAQPNALAFGKPDASNGHKDFPGDRPSLSLLMPVCDAFHVGALLAIYEHRTAVQSFIWNTNAFDQWGVELGKILAKNLRPALANKQMAEGDHEGQNLLLKQYLA